MFVPASEIKRTKPLLMAFEGMTGSGKTYSALLLAQAIAKARGGDVFAIDSDNGRMIDYAEAATHYPQLTPFKYLELTAPFTSEKYIAAIQEADAAGAGCIVLDSVSDEWDSQGGVIDRQHDTAIRMGEAAKKHPSTMNMPAWAEVKGPHNAFLDAMTRMKAPLIVCFRARDKTGVDKQGKPMPLGIQPVGDPRMAHIFRFILRMNQYGKGAYSSASKFYGHEAHVFPENGKVDADAARRLVETFYTVKQTPAGKWTPDQNGVLHYSLDNPNSTEAKRELFRYFTGLLNPDALDTESKCKIAMNISLANQKLIDNLPESGRMKVAQMVFDIEKKEGGKKNG